MVDDGPFAEYNSQCMALSDQSASSSSAATPSSTATSPSASVPVRQRRRWGRWVALSVSLIVLLFALYVGLFLGIPAWQGYQAAQQLRTAAADGLAANDAPVIEDAVVQLDRAYNALADGMRPFHPLIRLLGFVPQWGGTIAAAPELMAIGRDASALAAEMTPVLEPALAADGMLARVSALASTLGDDTARIDRMAEYAGRIAQQTAALPVADLEPRIAAVLTEAQPLLPLLPDLVRALPGLPVLLGNDEPHTYLLLVQNNHELRPTGGFITAVGRVTLDMGEIVELDFSDSYAIFRGDTTHPPPPAPMQRYMGIPYLVFRDANWSPDLPTSSAVAHALYTLDSNLDYDDTITIDLFAVERLIDALAPLHLKDIDTPITGANVLEVVKELWARPAGTDSDVAASVPGWWGDRKDFIPLVAQAALEKVMGGDIDAGKLAAATLTALDNREIQMVTTAPGVKEMLAERGWDGALTPPESGDYLAVVDTNFGYNKANAAVARELSYVVTPPVLEDARAVATLTLTYTHPVTEDDPGCDQTPRYGNSYDDMVARCYFDYLRVYAPPGSELLEMTGVFADSVTSQRSEKNTQQFAGYFILPTNESNTVTLSWLLAPEVNQRLADDAYTLRIQRQAGSGALPLSIHVNDASLSTVLVKGLLDWSSATENDPIGE